MRKLIMFAILLVAPMTYADSGSDVAAGSDASGSGSGSVVPVADALAMRKECADAMNANPTFANDIVMQADKAAAERRLAADAAQHEEAQRHIATDERSVIVAYVAMWLVAVGFVLFLNHRQAVLRREIAMLRRDLEAALKDSV